ncbi:hypothetical protein ACFW95_44575 [Streptomyces sp. NPDC059474]|uniref:hypothetical protein n=1 Tax=unclassified Streptomyces TaxID=2593676 RepID=UPI00341115B1
MTALLDTRRALEEQVTALGERVETSRREIAETVTTQVSDLHADNRETRNRVNSASTSLAEINKSLPGLRQEVTDLSRVVHDLRTTVDNLFAHLPGASTALPARSVDSPAHDRTPEQPDPDEHSGASFPQEPDTTTSTNENAETGDTEAAPPPDPHQAKAGPEDAAQRRAAADAVADAHPDAHTQPAAGSSAPDADAAPSSDNDSVRGSLAKHDNVLGTAATVGSVHLICHRDMWDFIQEHAADIPHFRAPAAPSEQGDERLRITLSGRSVIGVLIAMRDTQTKNAKYGKDDGTWALSGAVYRRLAHDLSTTSRSGTVPLTVVFDDGTGTPSECH